MAAQEAGLDAKTDSAGTAAYHIGAPPDPRSIDTAARNGADIRHYRGRQIKQSDFINFTHIFALDESNLADILQMARTENSAEIMLLMDTLAGYEGRTVADPYYGDDAGFDVTWDDVSRAADALVKSLKQQTSY
ncbi:hypothetical protein GCM10023115_19160 [Pontixanthobacter gangjinensis]